jgi:hypothetical protein
VISSGKADQTRVSMITDLHDFRQLSAARSTPTCCSTYVALSDSTRRSARLRQTRRGAIACDKKTRSPSTSITPACVPHTALDRRLTAITVADGNLAEGPAGCVGAARRRVRARSWLGMLIFQRDWALKRV